MARKTTFSVKDIFVAGNHKVMKMTLVYFFIYFIGPIIWGVWMIYKLRIVSVHEFWQCIISPITIAMLLSYFIFNILYMRRRLNEASANLLCGNDNGIYDMSALKVHYTSITSFGTIATSVFMFLLTEHNGLAGLDPRFWLPTIIIGSLSGTSLVLLFYIIFSVMIFTSMTDSRNKAVFIRLRLVNLIMYIIGLALFVGTAAGALIYNNYYIGQPLNKDPMVFFITLLLPILMSTLMFVKGKKKIEAIIAFNKNSVSKTTYKVRRFVQLFFLVLFLVLMITSNMKMWLPVLILGFCTSLIAGRIYCGWFCPAHAMNELIELVCKRFRVEKRNTRPWLHSSLLGVTMLMLFLGLFTGSLIAGVRVQLFTIITFLGVFVSSLFTSNVWCKYLCPWGTVFKITSKPALFKWHVDERKCIKCKICERSCPSKAIQISNDIQLIDFIACVQCLQCLNKCPKNAIEMGRLQRRQMRTCPIAE